MIVLFTDFGPGGPYTGQMKAVLAREAPGIPVIDLADDLPACDPEPAAYLLAAFARAFPPGAVFVCVVDPGVGSDRAPVALSTDERWYVGPDNGLLAIAARRADDARWFTIDWRPLSLSPSFHGRDLFAPVAARIARGEAVPGTPLDVDATVGIDWPARPRCDRLYRPLRQRDDGAARGPFADRRDDRRERPAAQAAAHILRRSAGCGLLVRERQRPRRDCGHRGRADRLLGLQVGTPVRIETVGGAG